MMMRSIFEGDGIKKIIFYINGSEQFLNKIEMQKPYSFRTEPWGSLNEREYSILDQDFVHDKLFTARLSQTTSKGSIELQNQIVQKDAGVKSKGEIKLWFPVKNDKILYFRSQNNEVKLHYDHGIVKYRGYDFSAYASFQLQKNFLNPTLKFGGAYLSDKVVYDLRFKLTNAFADRSIAQETEIAKKVTFKSGKWIVDGYKVVDWTSFMLSRNAFQVAYKQDENNQFVFRGQNNSARNLKKIDYTNPDILAKQFFLNYSRRIDSNTRTALEVELSKQGFVGCRVGVEKNLPERNATFRVRADSNRSISMVHEGLLKNYGKFALGLELSDIGNKNILKYGCKIDLNL